ncbi:MAG: aminomethyltransferase family protein, partial [Erythrobacter sp.]
QEHETVRQLRLSPLYKRLKQAGAVYGSKNGWERPLWFAPKDVAPIDQLDFLDPGWTQFVAEEHRCVRERVALIDQTSFSKFDILGDGTCDALQKLCVSNMDKPKGAIIYTQMCNPEGGIEADITFIRLGPDHYRMITGSGFGVRDSDWLKRNLAHGIHVIDVTSSYAVLNLVGPKSRLVLEANSEDDVSNTMIPFAKARDIIVGAAPVLAARIGYVGELGYELHIPTEFAAHVYDLLWAAGQSHGIANVGYRAVEGLRMEKGYVYWSGDISPDYTPIEAGLGFRVHLNSKGDFIGRAALKQQIQDGPKRRLCTFVTDAPLPLTGGETILLGNQTVSLATSVGFGHTVGKTILRGYLEAAHWDQSAFTLEVFGEHHPITRISGPAYDPENKALKA